MPVSAPHDPIAERGYWFNPEGASSVAFFPLLPLLMKGLGAVTGNYAAAGLLITNLAALGAVLALWRWVRAEAGPAAAERAALWLLVYGGRSRSRPMMTRRISDVPPPHSRKRASRK